jgi:uncharacterized membrane protein YphA (DoxX/SURF4 family)
MPQELITRPERRELVGRSGIYPASGPFPLGNAPLRAQGELAHPEERTRLASLPALTERSALALGRLLFGGYFVYNGLNHFFNRKAMTAYAKAKEVPAAGLAVPGSGLLILLGGLSLVTGIQPRLGASLVTAFLLGVTPRMHAFWTVGDEGERAAELVNFAKNVALIGGAAFAAAVPEPWPTRGQGSGALVTFTA